MKSRKKILSEILARDCAWRRRKERHEQLVAMDPSPGTQSGQAARDRLWLLCEVMRLQSLLEETMPAFEFLQKVGDSSVVVSAASMSEEDVAEARRVGALYENQQFFALVRRDARDLL